MGIGLRDDPDRCPPGVTENDALDVGRREGQLEQIILDERPPAATRCCRRARRSRPRPCTTTTRTSPTSRADPLVNEQVGAVRRGHGGPRGRRVEAVPRQLHLDAGGVPTADLEAVHGGQRLVQAEQHGDPRRAGISGAQSFDLLGRSEAVPADRPQGIPAADQHGVGRFELGRVRVPRRDRRGAVRHRKPVATRHRPGWPAGRSTRGPPTSSSARAPRGAGGRRPRAWPRPPRVGSGGPHPRRRSGSTPGSHAATRCRWARMPCPVARLTTAMMPHMGVHLLGDAVVRSTSASIDPAGPRVSDVEWLRCCSEEQGYRSRLFRTDTGPSLGPGRQGPGRSDPPTAAARRSAAVGPPRASAPRP